MSLGISLREVFVSRQTVGTVWPEVEMARTRNRGERELIVWGMNWPLSCLA